MSSPTNILDDIAAKIEEEKQAVTAKYESKVHLYIYEAYSNAKSVDRRLSKLCCGMGGVALFGQFVTVDGEEQDANMGHFDWRKMNKIDQPKFVETRRLLDLLDTYDRLLPHDLPYIDDIE